jgi:hypothetical protein
MATSQGDFDRRSHLSHRVLEIVKSEVIELGQNNHFNAQLFAVIAKVMHAGQSVDNLWIVSVAADPVL